MGTSATVGRSRTNCPVAACTSLISIVARPEENRNEPDAAAVSATAARFSRHERLRHPLTSEAHRGHLPSRDESGGRQRRDAIPACKSRLPRHSFHSSISPGIKLDDYRWTTSSCQSCGPQQFASSARRDGLLDRSLSAKAVERQPRAEMTARRHERHRTFRSRRSWGRALTHRQRVLLDPLPLLVHS